MSKKKKLMSKHNSQLACNIIDYKLDLVIALDSSNFNNEDFDIIIEGIGTLIDESFDLAPDVVQIGFIVYR